MLKFILITVLIWFILTKVFRLKLIVFKNTSGPRHQNYEHSNRKEGSIVIEKIPQKKKTEQDTKGGDYVDYEEV
jgi:hypothetical protein